MKFNRFIWDLYKESAHGQRALARCARFNDALSDASFLYGLFGMSLDLNALSPEERATDEGTAQAIEAVKNYAAKFNITSPEQALKAYEKLVKAGFPFPHEMGQVKRSA